MTTQVKNTAYTSFLKEIKEKVHRAQYEALKQVNQTTIQKSSKPFTTKGDKDIFFIRGHQPTRSMQLGSELFVTTPPVAHNHGLWHISYLLQTRRGFTL